MANTRYVKEVKRLAKAALEDYLLYSRFSKLSLGKSEEDAVYYQGVAMLHYEDAMRYSEKAAFLICCSTEEIFDEAYQKAVEEFNQ